MNEIYFENCIEVLKRQPDNSIDLFLQDPPFEVTANEWDKGFIEKLPELWELWIKKGKINTPFIFKATFPFAIDLINSNRKLFKYEYVWKKNKYTNFANATKMPMRCIEYIFIFYQKQPTYNPILRQNKYPKSGGRIRENSSGTTYGQICNKDYKIPTREFGTPINFIEIDHEKSAFVSTNGSQNRHPNRTNPELWQYFIQTYSNEGDVIFDGYAGSGSVAEACIVTNRNFICCENLEKNYLDAKKNIQNAKDKILHGYDKTNLEMGNNLFATNRK